MPISEKEKRKEDLMEVSKVLLYCAKKTLFLYSCHCHGKELYFLTKESCHDLSPFFNCFDKNHCKGLIPSGWSREMAINARIDHMLNGYLCFECDCKEAIRVVYDKDPKISAYAVLS